MKPKFLNRRETAILVLPVAMIAAGGAWMNARNQEQLRKKSGPLRTVITTVEVQDVTPFEAWQGFERRVVVKAELQGQNEIPEGLNLWPNSELDSDVHLNGKIAGREQKVGIGARTSSPERVDILGKASFLSVYSYWPPPGYNTFLIRASRFDAAPLHLRGRVRIRQRATRKIKGANVPSGWKISDWSRSLGDAVERPSQPASFEVLVPRDVAVVDRNAPEVLESEKISLSPRSERIGMFDGQGDTQIRVRFKPFTESSTMRFEDKHRIFIGPTDIIDEKNQTVEFKSRRNYSVNLRFSGYSSHADGTWEVEHRIPIWDIPTSHGALRYRTFISRAGSWPVKIEIPLRTKQELAPPKLLRLESVRAEGANVRVRVKYLGSKSVSTQYENEFFDSRTEGMILSRMPPKAANEDHLISNWSQHLTASNGKEYWFPNAVSVQSVTQVAPQTFEIVYKTNALAALKVGEKMKFSTHVGIENDGFLPVTTEIFKAK